MKISIKAVRITLQLSVTEVARKMGVSVNTISNWERGVSEPSASQFKRLCNLYDVDWEQVEIPMKKNKPENTPEV